MMEPKRKCEITKERREFLIPTSEKDNTKWYRHREDGYEVQAYPSNCSELECYTVLGYGDGGKMYGRNAFIRLVVSDFEKLFEPIPEYCCDWFEKCVRMGVIVNYPHLKIVSANTPTVLEENLWRWNTVYEVLAECPFCETKL